jgi:hypothetical protein
MVAHLEQRSATIAWEQPYGPGKWQRIEVLGHLVDSAMNNCQRFVRAMIQPSLEFPAYQQVEFVAVQSYRSYPPAALLALWSSLNLWIAHVIEHAPADKLATPCRIGDGEPVTLEYLMVDYLRHQLHHLADIERA